MVAGRSLSQLEELAADLGSRDRVAIAAECDVSSPDSIQRLAARASAELGPVDILVNNAGIAGSAPIKSLTLEDWNRIMTVNATGTFLCTQAFLPGMAERGFGRVVNVASITSRMGAPYIAAYTASKHAVLGFTRVAAAEYARHGVTVNAVCPGYVDTEMTEISVSRVAQKTGKSRNEALQEILRTANQKRLITPEEVAYVVVSLCANQAGAINGQAIVVDGGGLLA